MIRTKTRFKDVHHIYKQNMIFQMNIRQVYPVVKKLRP